MKTAIVTGAGGFIGGALTKNLLEKGWKVYGVDIRPLPINRNAGPGKFIPICGDLGEKSVLSQIEEQTDVFFHLANGGNWWKNLNDPGFQIDSLSMTLRLFQAVEGVCKKFLFGSSTYEYMRPMGERKIPCNIYGIAKKAAAEMCAAICCKRGIDFNKIVLTNTFGIGDYSDKAVNTLIRRLLKWEEPMLVAGNNKNDWVYIDDTVESMIAVAEMGKSFQEYYIGHREITTFKAKMIDMRDVLCPDMPLHFGTMTEDTYVDYDAIDLDALYRDTGFECKADFRESILKTAAWLKDEQEKASENVRGGVLSNSRILSFPVAAERAVAA